MAEPAVPSDAADAAEGPSSDVHVQAPRGDPYVKVRTSIRAPKILAYLFPERQWIDDSWKEIASLAERHVLEDLTPRDREIFKLRWLDEAKHYDRLWRRQRGIYRVLRVTAIVAGVLVPVFVGSHLRTLSVIAGAFVAAAAGLDGFFGFGERYQEQRLTARRLKAEGIAYMEHRDSYKDKSYKDAFPAFIDAVERINETQSEKYASMAREGRPGK